MIFGLIRERKNPPDHRVVLSPTACQKVLNKFPKAEIRVESSPVRVFADEEYHSAGIPLVPNVLDCDVMLGVKEVPIEALIPGKKYFFFSHTIKKQPYNRELLRAILRKNIELYDHEVLTNQKGRRLVAFGRYAGIVGAYNGFRAFGLKFGTFQLPKAALIRELQQIEMPPVKILLTGRGRVGSGAREMLDGMGLVKWPSMNICRKSSMSRSTARSMRPSTTNEKMGCGVTRKNSSPVRNSMNLTSSVFPGRQISS